MTDDFDDAIEVDTVLTPDEDAGYLDVGKSLLIIASLITLVIVAVALFQ